MEEDAGKLLHMGGATGRIQGADYSLIDYNRAGVPLIEIVTKPIRGTGAKAPEVAKAYVAWLRDVLRGLGVSDVRMEQGSLRCDANVSLMPKGTHELGTRTETKNVNSLRSVERALRYEITRQAAVLNCGGRIIQETRHWHEDGGFTSPGRNKEQAEDYRYFPEPDLVPIAPSREWVEELRATLPEPPAVRTQRLQTEWGFTDREFGDILANGVLDLVEATVDAGASPVSARKWWLTELARRANEAGVELDEIGMSPVQVAALQKLVDAGTINDKLARQVIDGVLAGEGRAGRGRTVAWPGRRLGLGCSRGCRRQGHRRRSRRRPEDPRRQGPGRRCAHRSGDEGDARPGRRGSRTSVAAGASVLTLRSSADSESREPALERTWQASTRGVTTRAAKAACRCRY